MHVDKHAENQHEDLVVEVTRLHTIVTGLLELLAPSGERAHEHDGAAVSVSPLRAFIIRRRLAELRERVGVLDSHLEELMARPSSTQKIAIIPHSPRARRRRLSAWALLALFVTGIASGALVGVHQRFTSPVATSAPPAVAMARRAEPMELAQAQALATATAHAVLRDSTAPGATDSAMRFQRDQSELTPASQEGIWLDDDWQMTLATTFVAHGWGTRGAVLYNDGSDFGDENWQDGIWNRHWIGVPFGMDEHGGGYSVEAEIKVVTRPPCGSFGLVGRGEYQAGVHFCSEYGRPVFSIRSSAPELIIAMPFDVDENWHRYRLEVHRGIVRALVDGTVVAEVEGASSQGGSRIGLWDDHTMLEVRDFQGLVLTND